MEKIDFINNSQPALNSTNLNKVQDNVEDAIQEVQDDVDTKLTTNNIKAIQTTSDTDTYSCTYINGIVESGSNTNGSWVKFIDGTMICRKTMNFGSVAITTTWGSFYESGALDCGDYAQTFIEIPQISIVPNSPFFVEKYGDASTSSWGKIYACCPRSKTENPTIVYCIAIGRWK